jgi:uncharacterized protein (TIGR02466 family)
MPIKSLFATPFYQDAAADAGLLAELEHSCRVFEKEDKAGRLWSKENAYPGYTSYSSLDDLPQRDPGFADLKKIIDKHVKTFAKACDFAPGLKLRCNSLWVNILKPGGMHSGHIHPHSVISGTVYVRVPEGAGSLKLEDPRLPFMMGAPMRRDDAPEAVQPFVYAKPSPGSIFLWESWLRHEVMASQAKSDRISISFNYG